MDRMLIATFALALTTSTALAGQTMDMSGQHTQHQPVTQAAGPAEVVEPQTQGEIRKVDAAAQKLTVKHGPIVNLGMSPMTMVFRVQDPAFLTLVKPGDMVRMTVERVDGVLTIVALQRVP